MKKETRTHELQSTNGVSRVEEGRCVPARDSEGSTHDSDEKTSPASPLRIEELAVGCMSLGEEEKAPQAPSPAEPKADRAMAKKASPRAPSPAGKKERSLHDKTELHARDDPNAPEFVSQYLSLKEARKAGPALLPPKSHGHRNKKTLVLDLDETLVHSSFTPTANPDILLKVETKEAMAASVYVTKRPWVDVFLEFMGGLFEVVVFTASARRYASPLIDLLDIHGVVSHRLYRDHCTLHHGSYVKNLAALGRDMRSTIIVDNSPHAYMFQPENALPVLGFVGDRDDGELLELIPVLQSLADWRTPDVRTELKQWLRDVVD